MVALLSLMGTACVSFSPDGGMAPVAALSSSELRANVLKIASAEEEAQAQAQIARLLGIPLTPDTSAQIALLSNRGLQAEYNSLGISEADFVEATLPPLTPSVTIERAITEFECSVERALAVSLIRLVTYGKRRAVAEKRFEAAQFRAIEATFRLAADARRAFYRAVAAKQRVGFLTRARATAEIAADLTRRQGETGAQTKLVQGRASLFYLEVSAELARARLEAESSREALIRSLGLWGIDIHFSLPAALPGLPAIRSEPDVEREAVSRRVDIVASRLELDATAVDLGLTEATRYVSLFELTGRRTTTWTREEGSLEAETTDGIEVELEVPIFDLGETSSRRAREAYLLAMNELIELAVNARSQAREAYTIYRGSYDIAVLYQNKITPLRQSIDEQTLLEYNGMLVDVFDLLTTARESIESNIAAIEAKRDFFLAEVDFDSAVIGGGVDSEGAGAAPDLAESDELSGH